MGHNCNSDFNVHDKLYQYMTLEKFVVMIATSSLKFVNPLTEWEDKKEGYFFRLAHMLRDDKYREYRRYLREAINDNKLISEKFKTEIFRLFTTGMLKPDDEGGTDWLGARFQSWTFKENCARMWDRYATNKVVCVTSDFYSLSGMDSIAEGKELSGSEDVEHPIEWCCVKYKNLPDIDFWDSKEVQRYIAESVKELVEEKNASSFCGVFEYKASEFSWEDELRICIRTDEKGNVIFRKRKNLNFVQGVKVHPYADKSFCETIENLCKKYAIPYTGKGKYSIPCCCNT